MHSTTIAEEIAENYREKLIRFYKMNNLDPIIIKQVQEFDTEALLCMATREAIHLYEEILQKKEEQKQH